MAQRRTTEHPKVVMTREPYSNTSRLTQELRKELAEKARPANGGSYKAGPTPTTGFGRTDAECAAMAGCDGPPISRGEIETERYRLAAALDVLRGVATDLTERISTACRSLPEVKPTAEFEQLETAIGTDLRRMSLQAEGIAAHLRMVCEAVEL